MLTLYSRPECHLCDEAREIVGIAAGEQDIQHIDISGVPALESRYAPRIPVLALGERELDWPFGIPDIRAFIEQGNA